VIEGRGPGIHDKHSLCSIWRWVDQSTDSAMIARNKRVVSGYNIANMDLSEWIDPKSYGALDVFLASLDRFLELLGKDKGWLGRANKYGLHNLMASFAYSYVNVKIGYRSDTEMFKRYDWWNLPSETIELGKGDCEDTSFLLSSSIEHICSFCMVEPSYYCTLGYYHAGGAYYGHAYVLYHHTYAKKWCVLETTYDHEVSPFVWLVWNPDTYIPAICFNRKDELVMTNHDHRERLGLGDGWYERHKEAIEDMIKYVQTGELLKCSFMHKKERPAPEQKMERLE